jgi:hypothetical protein
MNTAQPLFLRYRNAPLDPWIEPPDLSASLTGCPAGAVPIVEAMIYTAPELEPVCGCPDDADADDHLALKAGSMRLRSGDALAVLQYLLLFKLATYAEAKFATFGDADYIGVAMTNIRLKEEAGGTQIQFRVAAPIASAI